MDEHIAAVVIALITAFFGFLGLVLSTWLAQKKGEKAIAREEQSRATSRPDLFGPSISDRDTMDQIKHLRLDIKELGLDLQLELRDGLKDIMRAIERKDQK